MSQKKYKKLELNPRNRQWFESGQVVLLEKSAELLNFHSNVTGIKYEQVKTRAKKKEEIKE